MLLDQLLKQLKEAQEQVQKAQELARQEARLKEEAQKLAQEEARLKEEAQAELYQMKSILKLSS